MSRFMVWVAGLKSGQLVVLVLGLLASVALSSTLYMRGQTGFMFGLAVGAFATLDLIITLHILTRLRARANKRRSGRP